MMDELISRICDNVGIEPDTARQAVIIIFNFINKEGDSEAVASLMQAIPDAQDYLSEAGDAKKGGGLMGLMGAGGIMAAANQLMSAGLGMGEVQQVTKEVIRFAREKAGDEAVDSLVASIPGLSQFA
jgi:hypothetical protein